MGSSTNSEKIGLQAGFSFVGANFGLDTGIVDVGASVKGLEVEVALSGIKLETANTGAHFSYEYTGVKVTYDAAKNSFVFTTGTKGADSFIKISGSSNWGLETVEAGRGATTTWVKPTQFKDVVNGTVQPKYIDSAGNETTNGDGFTTLPPWSPIFLDKGELSFDTGGNLVSPVKGTQLETVFLAGGKVL